MVTSPSSLHPPTDRRSISIDDYKPPSPAPQSSSSESDNDENDTPTPLPTRPPRRRAPRKSASSISLDSLDRDELPEDTIPAQPLQPSQPTQQPQQVQRSQPSQPPKPPPPPPPRSTAEPPLVNQPLKLHKSKELVKDNLPVPGSTTPVTPSPEMDLDEPLSDDNLVNVAAIPANDDFAWDRFIFFSHRAQRHEFPEDCYLSNFSPFAAVASAMIGLTTRSVCAVCGAGGTMYSCIRCPLAFHPSCIDPLKTTPANASTPWMCPACKAAKNGEISPDWFPAPGRAPPPLPNSSTGLKRLVADAREGNPLDMIFHPSLFKYYKDIAGADWLRCARCRRIRIVRDGVLSEAVRIPFECSYAFWLDIGNRSCHSQESNRLQEKAEMRVIQYIRSRKTQRQLLFRFGFGEDDATDFDRPDIHNLPVLRSVQPLNAQPTLSSVAPMQMLSSTIPSTPATQQASVQRVQPVKPVVEERPQAQVVIPAQQATPPRQVVSTAVQQVQPQVGSASVTPQPSPDSSSQAGSGMVPAPTAVGPSLQQSPSMSRTSVDPSTTGVPKSEPLENAQNNQQDLLTFIASLDWEEWLEDALTDLALADNKQLIQLYVALRSAPAKFQRQATRLAQRMKGNMRPQPQSSPQPQVQPQQQLQPQRAPMQMNMPTQPQQSIQPQQSMHPQHAPQQMSMQQPQRIRQATVDQMYRQMAIKHVREIQELEQEFMRRMEHVPVAQVAGLMSLKDSTVASLRQRQQEEIRRFYQTHGIR